MSKIANKKPLIKDLDTITREYALAVCQEQVYSLIANLTPTHRNNLESEELGFVGFALDEVRSKFMFTYRWPSDKYLCRQFFYFEVEEDKIKGITYIKQGAHLPWELLKHDENKNLGE